MYAGRVACCPSVSHGEYADWTDTQTDRRTDPRPLHYAFRYGRDQRKYNVLCLICDVRYKSVRYRSPIHVRALCSSFRSGRPGVRPMPVPALSLAVGRVVVARSSRRRRTPGRETVDIEYAVSGRRQRQLDVTAGV